MYPSFGPALCTDAFSRTEFCRNSLKSMLMQLLTIMSIVQSVLMECELLAREQHFCRTKNTVST